MLGDLLMEVNGTMTSVSVGKPVPEGSRVDAEVASEISGRSTVLPWRPITSSSDQTVELDLAKAAACSTLPMARRFRSTTRWGWDELPLQGPLP